MYIVYAFVEIICSLYSVVPVLDEVTIYTSRAGCVHSVCICAVCRNHLFPVFWCTCNVKSFLQHTTCAGCVLSVVKITSWASARSRELVHQLYRLCTLRHVAGCRYRSFYYSTAFTVWRVGNYTAHSSCADVVWLCCCSLSSTSNVCQM